MVMRKAIAADKVYGEHGRLRWKPGNDKGEMECYSEKSRVSRCVGHCKLGVNYNVLCSIFFQWLVRLALRNHVSRSLLEW
jgi:hypothetical protein